MGANLSNFHSHCSFCDGRAPMEDFIRTAIASGFSSYAVTSHAPLPFDTFWTMTRERVQRYLAEFMRIKPIYEAQIEYYVGMEIDYIDAEHNPSIDYFKNLPLDIRIGSVHLLKRDDNLGYLDTDGPYAEFAETVQTAFHGDIKEVVFRYFSQLEKMITAGGIDFVGHCDKISLNGTRYDPDLRLYKWYNERINSFFEFVAEHRMMIEINTKGYGREGVFFPNSDHFGKIRDLQIPVIVNSDAHVPAKINESRPEALQTLKRNGIYNVMEYHQNRWVSVPIE